MLSSDLDCLPRGLERWLLWLHQAEPQHPHGGSQWSVTPVPAYLAPSFGLHGHQAHKAQTDTHRQITHTDKINQQFQQRNNGRIKVCVFRAHSFSPNHSDKAGWICGREACIDRETRTYKLSHGEISSTGVGQFKAATCFMAPREDPMGRTVTWKNAPK